MIYVTHDQIEAMTMADRIVVLKDGVIQQVGTPLELYENPNSLFVAQFIGSPKMNIMTGRHAEKFAAHFVGVRPEHLTVVDDGIWSGTLIHAENLGADSFLYLDIGEEDPLAIRLSGSVIIAPGTVLSVAPVANQIHLFDDLGQPVALAEKAIDLV